MSDERIYSTRGPAPVGPYPHARRVGDFIFVSGMGPRKAGTNEIPGVQLDSAGNVLSHDVQAQTRAVIENVAIILEDAGCSLEDVVDVTVFLTDIERDFAPFNRIYAEYFGEIQPSRTTVGVTGLPTPIAVELKVIAKARG
jgi:2-aminomuconate deaminase